MTEENVIKYEVIRSFIEDAKHNVVLDFSAEWCGPCKKLYPIIKKLSNKYTNILFFKIDIGKGDDENLGDLYNISSLPTCLFFHNGQLLVKEEGLQPGASNIIDALATLISKSCETDKDEIITEINNYLLDNCENKYSQ